jgi:arylsulfatase A-like enzyme
MRSVPVPAARALVLLVIAGAAGLSCGSPRKRAFERRPNVVVFLLDTLRPDYLDAYGYPRTTAPFLSEMAEQSVVFEQAFSTSSWTVPSVASLFTSAYPHQHRVVQGLMAHKEQLGKLEKEARAKLTLNRLSADVPTLPEHFKELGYSTYGIAANVNLGPELGFQRGFDKFHFEPGLSARHLHGILATWMEELSRSKPFFAYLHLNDVHSPFEEREPYYQPPASGDPKDITRERYLSEIGFLDEYLRKICELFSEDDNTLFVFLSDHGEEFWDHGGTFHGATLYRELTQVLLMFSAPAIGIEPRRVTADTNLIDVLPTLVDFAGGPPDARFEGYSLRPLLEDSAEAPALERLLRERTLYAHLAPRGNARHRWAAFDRGSYLIETSSGGKKLFDRSDLAQENELYLSRPQRAQTLLALLEQVKQDDGRMNSETVEVDLDPKLLETLRSLGYVEP